jgi:hypothetical protein
MNSGRTVFSQLIEHLPHKEFQKCVARYRGDRYAKNFSCWDQYLAMAFAQLTYRESLRDIETCLGAVAGKLYHMGFHASVARSTLADANESRDWRIYADFAQTLIGTARTLYARDPLGVDLEQSLYALDSTTIDLCLSLFPWAKFRRRKAAVKMHTLLDLHGNIPTFIRVTSGNVHDVNLLDEILPEAGAFYVMGLHRFSEALRLYTQLGLLRRARQVERVAPTTLLASGGQEHGRALGSDSDSDILRIRLSVSRCPAARKLLRRGDQQAAEIPDQQFCAPRTDHRANLQVSLAGGTVLQMDQAAPAHQSLLRDQRECGEDPDMDRGVGLCAGGNPTQAVEAAGQSLPNATDSERHAFRENAHFMRPSGHRWGSQFQ